MTVRRLLALYRSGSADEHARGRQWYADARVFVGELSERWSVPHEVAAGVLAVLSPNCAWETNKRDANAVLGAVHHRLAEYDVNVSTYRGNKVKAFTLAEEWSRVDVIRGPKVNAFWRNLCGDESVPTIDSHAINAFVGRRITGSNLPTPSVHIVRAATSAYVKGAAKIGETPAAFQAIIWIVWKRRIDEGKVRGYER